MMVITEYGREKVPNPYTDPPNIPLHYCIGIIKKSGLPVYRCWRGTNFTEGGVHRPIRRSLPISGVSPEHTYT